MPIREGWEGSVFGVDDPLFIALEGYESTEFISDNGEFTLFRALRVADRQAVLLKTPSALKPPPATPRQLDHEAGLADHLPSGWALRPLSLVRTPEREVLVLEDFGGQPLDSFADPQDLTRFFPMAIGIAKALDGIHRQDLIHKNLKPQNILVDPARGEAKLTGFGIASLLAREHQDLPGRDTLEGTLAYMAPEQTGRMNRVIDQRADLYTLGVIFYDLLTGSLPCSGRDPMEWVHCHIAIVPPPVVERNPRIPPALSAIVMKLLTKDPEERYQTARGLQADLERCFERWRSAQDAPFPLGSRDVSEAFHVPQRLYGREAEIAALRETFERVVQEGRPELALVSGYSGIGKSALALDLQQPVSQARGVFLTGKFDPVKRDIPYATLSQAFHELVQQILTEPEERIATWKRQILEALGVNAPLIAEVVPAIALLIGEQPPVPDLPMTEAQNRFLMVFRLFVEVFATRAHPLVLFLDDLQWADPASLTLIQHLLTHPDMGPLLVVGAYRSNEVGPEHPLERMCVELRGHAAVTEIVLEPLQVEDLVRLVADTLRSEPARADELGHLVYEKTQGNPFFAIQFLTTLVQEHVLAFDPVAARWDWELATIRAMSFTDNIVELMIGRLKRLPDATQGLMQVAACAGNQVDLTILAQLTGKTEAETLDELRPAIAEGLVLPQGRFVRFMHDRIQQAAYGLLSEERRRTLHLRIGRLLDHEASRRDEAIFEIVTQFNLGEDLLTDPAERHHVAALNLVAGRRAKDSAAYRSAITYLAEGLHLLPSEAWEIQHELTYALHVERATCELLSANFDACERVLSELLAHARTPLEKVPAYRLGIALFETTGATQRAVEWGSESLRMFGLDLPVHPSPERVGETVQAIWEQLGDRPIESLIDLPPMTDPEMEAAMEILSALPPVASWWDKNYFLLTVCHMVTLSLRYGNTSRSASGYVTFGMILGPAFGRFEEGRRFGQLACAMVDRQGVLAEIGVVYYVFGNMINHWTRHVRTDLAPLEVAFRTASEAGNLTYAGFACVGILSARLAMGQPLAEVYREATWRLDFVRKFKFRLVEETLLVYQRLIESLRGHTEALTRFDAPDFDEAAYEAFLTQHGHPVSVFWYYLARLRAAVMAGDHEAALVAAGRAEPMLEAVFIYFDSTEYHFYAALAMAGAWAKASAEQRESLRAKLDASHDRLRVWSESGPENFRDRYALVSAELARIQGHGPEAMRFYEQAIRAARESGFVQNEAIANELASRFYADQGFETIADAYLREARYAYLRWGAEGKVRQLERLHPQLQERPALPHAITLGASARELDLSTVIKASQAISQEILLPRLAETLMRAVIEHAGAQQGYLLLAQDGDLRVVAQAHADAPDVTLFLDARPSPALSLPESLINFVRRTGEKLVLDDARQQRLFASDPYIRDHRPRSVLGLPILRQAKLVGMLYLENNLSTGVFTAEKLTILDMLGAQAAISLENAQLYAERERAEAEVRTLNAELEQRVRDRTAQLAALNQELEAFSYSVSHDLRAPLRSIGGFSRIVLSRFGEQLDASGRDYLQRIRIASERMQALIEDLLQLSRLTRGDLRRSAVDLSAMARGIAERLHRSHPERQVEVQIAPGLVVEGDPRLLEVAMENLLGNAWKYTSKHPTARIELGAFEKDGHAVYYVRDDGAGFDMAYADRLFQPFQRLHADSEFEGTGIGLATVQRIIHRHGGRIWAEATRDKGATFFFTL